MNPLKGIVATGLLCSLVFVTTFCKQRKEEDKGYIVQVGQQAPDFELTTTEGKTVR